VRRLLLAARRRIHTNELPVNNWAPPTRDAQLHRAHNGPQTVVQRAPFLSRQTHDGLAAVKWAARGRRLAVLVAVLLAAGSVRASIALGGKWRRLRNIC